MTRDIHPEPELFLDVPPEGSEVEAATVLVALRFQYGGAAVTYQSTEQKAGNSPRLPEKEAVWAQWIRNQTTLERLGFRERRALGCHDPFDFKIDVPTVRLERFVDDFIPQVEKAGFRWAVSERFPVRPIELPKEWYFEAEPDDKRWFQLEMGVVVDGERIDLLPILVQALREQWSFLSEPENSRPTHWMLPIRGRRISVPVARIMPLVELIRELSNSQLKNVKRIRTSKAQALEFFRVAQREKMRSSGSNRIQNAVKRLYEAPSEDRARSPETLRAELRHYQREGLAWLQTLSGENLGGILADDMGLGKTIQVLSMILAAKEATAEARPSLVVAPTSVIHEWQAQVEAFCPKLSAMVYHGSQRARDRNQIGKLDLVITSYTVLRIDEELFRGHEFRFLIVDEAQHIKNPSTKAHRVVSSINAQSRFCLTGTPLENRLSDLWAQIDVVAPGLLSNQRAFVRVFQTPIENGDAKRLELLRGRLKPFLLRRRKEEVAPELPPKTTVVRKVDLDGKQRDLYEAIRLAMHDRVREELAKQGLARSQLTVLDALLKMRQVVCDPRLLKDQSGRKAQSAKLQALMEMLSELVEDGRRILLFSQFTSMLELIEEELKKAGMSWLKLTGQTKNRKELVARFQNKEVPIFLISLKAGGTGLNLTAADTVIHYDPWWNPAAEAQATDRAHRIGQDNPVFVYKLVGRNTIEEMILELQEKKSGMSQQVLDGGVLPKLTETEVLALFAPLASLDKS